MTTPEERRKFRLAFVETEDGDLTASVVKRLCDDLDAAEAEVERLRERVSELDPFNANPRYAPIGLSAQRAEQAEARVKELEAQLDHDHQAEHDLSDQRQGPTLDLGVVEYGARVGRPLDATTTFLLLEEYNDLQEQVRRDYAVTEKLRAKVKELESRLVRGFKKDYATIQTLRTRETEKVEALRQRAEQAEASVRELEARVEILKELWAAVERLGRDGITREARE